MKNGATRLISLFVLVTGAQTSLREVCYSHVAGAQLLRQGRQSDVKTCVRDTNDPQAIVCEANCNGFARRMNVFAVHDPSCPNIDRMSLTMIRRNSLRGALSQRAGATGNFRVFSSRWLRRVGFCPYISMSVAEVSLWADCNSGEEALAFRVALYNDLNEPVGCGNDHMLFFTG